MAFDSSFSLAVYLLASFVVFVDAVDFALRLYQRQQQARPADAPEEGPTSIPLEIGPFNPYQRKLHLRPYALAISVYNLGDELDAFVATVAPHRSRLYVIDDASSDLTPNRLEAAGLRVIRGARNRHKPGAIRELLNHLPEDVETVLIMDPDCRVLELVTGDISTLESVIFEFQRSHHAALCPRLTIRREGWLTRFQQLEYALTFGVGRKSLGDFAVTSGVSIYRRSALEAMLTEHSLSVYAEDLENTLRLLARGERIYYDERLVVETEGKTRVADLFSQRVGWAFGHAKVYAQNPGAVWRAARGNPMHFYQYVVYLGLLAMVFHPLKLLSLIPLAASALNGLDALLGASLVPDTALTSAGYFPVVYAQYTLLTLVMIALTGSAGERRQHVPVAFAYFFYVLGQLAPVTVGFLNWVSLRIAGRRLYRDHFADDAHTLG